MDKGLEALGRTSTGPRIHNENMTSSIHPYAWDEVTPGDWERKLTGLESLYAVTGAITRGLNEQGKMSSIVSSSIRLPILGQMEDDATMQVLRRAWIQLRFDKPDIAIQADPARLVHTYTVPTKATVTDWAQTTVLLLAEAPSEEEVYPDLPAVEMATLFYLPRSSELVFRAQHWMIDGIGVLTFWSIFLDILAPLLALKNLGDSEALAWGAETGRLEKTLDEMWDFRSQPTAEDQARLDEIKEVWLEYSPGIGPPSTVNTPAPLLKCAKVAVSFTAAETSAIVKACKERGITVTAAIHAAYILALDQNCGSALRGRGYGGMMDFNLRPLFPPNQDSGRSIGVYFLPAFVHLHFTTNFNHVTRKLQGFYGSYLDGGEDRAKFIGHHRRAIFDLLLTGELQSHPTSHDGGFSSLGVLDRFLTNKPGLDVEGFDFARDVMGGSSTVFVWTLRGELKIQWCYNSGQWKTADLEDVLMLTERTVLEELPSRGGL